MRYRLERPGDVDLEIDAEIISFQSSRKRNPRWTEIRIFRLADESKGWVTEMIGRTSHENERDLRTVTVCATPREVRESLRRREGEYLIDIAVQAIEEAAEQDPRLAEAAVERL